MLIRLGEEPVITYEGEGARFNYRVAGVSVHNDKVLLQKDEERGFWVLPGGRGELLEASLDTLKREMREELGIDVCVERLLWVVENFFTMDRTKYHELGLYFLMTFPEDSPLYVHDGPFHGEEEGVDLLYQWHPLDTLEELMLYPTVIQKALQAIPEVVGHVVHHDLGVG